MREFSCEMSLCWLQDEAGTKMEPDFVTDAPPDVSEMDGQMGVLPPQPVLNPAYYTPYYQCTALTNPPLDSLAEPPVTQTHSDGYIPQVDTSVSQEPVPTVTQNECIMTLPTAEGSEFDHPSLEPIQNLFEQIQTEPNNQAYLSAPQSPHVNDQTQRKLSCEDHQCSTDCQCQQLLLQDHLVQVESNTSEALISAIEVPNESQQDSNDADQVCMSLACFWVQLLRLNSMSIILFLPLFINFGGTIVNETI